MFTTRAHGCDRGPAVVARIVALDYRQRREGVAK